jgi:hypothetical protein
MLYRVIYIAFGLFIIIYAGFRTCSIDYEGYRMIFNHYQNLSVNNFIFEGLSYTEPGYALLNIVFDNYETLIFIMAFINIIIIFPFFHKYSPYPFVTMLFYSGLFLYSGLMGLIRQSLAISICLWLMSKYSSKKIIFFGGIGVAMLFHATAIIVIPVKLLKNLFYKLRFYVLILLIAILVNITFYVIFQKIIQYFPVFFREKLKYYLQIEQGTYFGLNNAVLIRLFTFILAYIYRKRIIVEFNQGALFVNIYFLALVIYITFGFLPQLSARGAIYFHYMELIVVPMILYVAKYNRLPIFFLYAAFSLMRHITMIQTHAKYYVPYTNWLFS